MTGPVITPEMLELQRELNDTYAAWAGASGVHQAMLGPKEPTDDHTAPATD